MPLISIIVPIYNREQYLHKCIDSILSQTFTDLECILINDGSVDNSPSICDDYAAKDSRVVVIHQKNAGVSAARNAGLDAAQGKWIGFVDSDDFCDPGMYEFLLTNAEKHQADISICGYRSLNENMEIFKKTKAFADITLSGKEAILDLFSLYSKYNTQYVYNKLINRKLFSDNDKTIRFDQTIKYSEDRLLLYFLLKKTDKIISSSSMYLNLCSGHDSITMRRKIIGLTPESKTRFIAYEKMIEVETDIEIKSQIMEKTCAAAVDSCFFHLKAKNYKRDNEYFYLKNIIDKYAKHYLKSANLKHKIKYCLVFFPFAIYLYHKTIYQIKKRVK